MFSSYVDLNMLLQDNSDSAMPGLSRSISSSASSSSSVSSSSYSSSSDSTSSLAPKKKKSKAPKKIKTPLPLDFEPTPYTVLCGRARECFESEGNRRFRVLCNLHLEDYLNAPGKLEKSRIVTKIMRIIRQSSPVGAFVSFENGRYYEVSQRTAREKVGGFFRDSLHTVYRSSAKAKLARKRAESNTTTTATTAVNPEAVAAVAPPAAPSPSYHHQQQVTPTWDDIIEMSLLECIAPVDTNVFEDSMLSLLDATTFFDV